MKIQDITSDAADALRGIPVLAGREVIEEDKGNVETNIRTAIGKTSLCVVVGWNGFTPRIVGDTAPRGTPFGTVSVVVSVFERPHVNRAKTGAPRLLDVAQEVAKALDGAASEGMEDVMHLKRIAPVAEVGAAGDVFTTVEFETKATL